MLVFLDGDGQAYTEAADGHGARPDDRPGLTRGRLHDRAARRSPTPSTAPGGADFVASIDARNAAEIAGYGTPDVAYPAEELLPYLARLRTSPKCCGARGSTAASSARATHEWQLDDDDGRAGSTVQVHPDVEGRASAARSPTRSRSTPRSLGRSRLITYAVSADAPGERLVPPTGAGSVPAGNREVRFLLARGWRLEQIARGESLPAARRRGGCRGPPRGRRASGRRGLPHPPWSGPTPERWLDDQAMLFTRMSTEEPTAGLESPEDPWDEERVRELRRAAGDGGPRDLFTAAAEHVATGTLVGVHAARRARRRRAPGDPGGHPRAARAPRPPARDAAEGREPAVPRARWRPVTRAC